MINLSEKGKLEIITVVVVPSTSTYRYRRERERREKEEEVLVQEKERKHVSFTDDSFCNHHRLTNVDTYAERSGL
jgi:hypothetical protein